MPQFKAKRRVRHSANHMFALVVDMERYPEFVPLCRDMRVRGLTEIDEGVTVATARMTVAYKMIREIFTTKVTMHEPELWITVEYLDGPLHVLSNHWSFRPISETASEVEFYHRLRVQEPHPQRGDGRGIRSRLPPLRFSVRKARRSGLRKQRLARHRIQLEHFPAKWKPVRRRKCDHLRTNKSEFRFHWNGIRSRTNPRFRRRRRLPALPTARAPRRPRRGAPAAARCRRTASPEQ